MRVNAIALLLACAYLVGNAQAAITLGFTAYTNNKAADVATASQYKVVISDAGAGLVDFKFMNNGPLASSITDVYFDDGTLLDIGSITNGPGVDYSEGATPGNLPGSGPFQATAGFTADSNQPREPNGANPGEWVTVHFSLQGTLDFHDTLVALSKGYATGGLRIGIKVQGFDGGGSESFVNVIPGPPPPRTTTDNPVPEPATLAMWGLGLGVAGLVRLARRKK